MKKHLTLFLFFLLTTCCVFADSIEITPTHLLLSAKEPIGLIEVKNLNAYPVDIQIETYSWKQKNNDEDLSLTKEIFASPPIFRLPPKKTQLVRVAMRTKPDEVWEKTYRLMVHEINPIKLSQDAASSANALQITLQFSLPVFVLPNQPIKEKFVWLGKKTATNQWRLQIKNLGTDVLFVNQLQLYDKTGNKISAEIKSFAYILPHKNFQWEAKLTSVPASVNFMLNNQPKTANVQTQF